MTILKKQFSLGHTHTHTIFIFNFQFGTKSFIVIVVVKFLIVFQCLIKTKHVEWKKKVEGNLMLRGKHIAV